MTDGQPISPELLAANAPRAWGLITSFAKSGDADMDLAAAGEALLSDVVEEDVGALLLTLAALAAVVVHVAVGCIATATKEAWKQSLATSGVDGEQFEIVWTRMIEPTVDTNAFRDAILTGVGQQVPTMDWSSGPTE